ncbi:MAG: lichenicidin A2 family type 2 lantibiotic [Butyrivibrio sp.]|nr:lichenicidin A2 family type 2 lantibiotic [Butyrivibrio sp.]
MSKKDLNKVVGASYEDLNEEDMKQTQGAGDVDPEVATPVLSMVGPIASISVTVIINKK